MLAILRWNPAVQPLVEASADQPDSNSLHRRQCTVPEYQRHHREPHSEKKAQYSRAPAELSSPVQNASRRRGTQLERPKMTLGYETVNKTANEAASPRQAEEDSTPSLTARGLRDQLDVRTRQRQRPLCDSGVGSTMPSARLVSRQAIWISNQASAQRIQQQVRPLSSLHTQSY